MGGREGEGKRGCPSLLAFMHLSQCPGKQMTSHLAFFFFFFFPPFSSLSLPSYNQTGITPFTWLSRRGCGWVVAVIPARPEGPVPEQERLCAAQILASLSLWTGCFLLQYWEDPTGREEPWLVTYLSQTVREGYSASVPF